MAIASAPASSGGILTSPVSSFYKPPRSSRRSSPEALGKLPPRSRARGTCCSASDTVPFKPRTSLSLWIAG